MAISNEQQFMDYGLDNLDATRRLVRRLNGIHPEWMGQGRSNATSGSKPGGGKRTPKGGRPKKAPTSRAGETAAAAAT